MPNTNESTEERLKSLEDKQDEVIRILQEAGGELQKISETYSLDFEQKMTAVFKAMIRAAGQLRSIKPRGAK